MIGREETASRYTTGGLDWMSGRISSRKGELVIATGCPGKWWNCHPWRYLGHTWMRCLGMQFSGAFVSVRLMIGNDDLKGHFQPK